MLQKVEVDKFTEKTLKDLGLLDEQGIPNVEKIKQDSRFRVEQDANLIKVKQWLTD